MRTASGLVLKRTRKQTSYPDSTFHPDALQVYFTRHTQPLALPSRF